ncbi:alcohol dehydrogenase, propanol-preferring [Sesbania bispinosa]|nr:alcohol dehydrogenase, propanol-preferring [Sesbania bispinosa]
MRHCVRCAVSVPVAKFEALVPSLILVVAASVPRCCRLCRELRGGPVLFVAFPQRSPPWQTVLTTVQEHFTIV